MTGRPYRSIIVVQIILCPYPLELTPILIAFNVSLKTNKNNSQ